MKAVIQRVRSASVVADGVFSGKCGFGLYILLGVAANDNDVDAALLAEKIAKLRIFSDENGKMNLSVTDMKGEALVVSNFTLNADYSHGNRPSYFGGAAPDEAKRLYLRFVDELASYSIPVATGVFGADMITDMQTDGPVTIFMDSDLLKGKTK